MDLRRMGVPKALTVASRAEIGRQPWTSRGGLWDPAGCARMGPAGRVRRHRCGNQDAGRNSPSWLGWRRSSLGTPVVAPLRLACQSASLPGYMLRTAHWGWPDRVGLASVTIGVALIVPAVVLQIIFRNGAVVAGPAVILFWVGILLLIYGRLHGRGDMLTRDWSSSPSRRGGHDKRRL